MLLETCMRYGQICYDEWDVENCNQRWQSPEKVMRDLGRDWKSIPVAKAQFITDGTDEVYCKVFEVKPHKEGLLYRIYQGCERCVLDKAYFFVPFYWIYVMIKSRYV